jgi:hypothetical protein
MKRITLNNKDYKVIESDYFYPSNHVSEGQAIKSQGVTLVYAWEPRTNSFTCHDWRLVNPKHRPHEYRNVMKEVSK